MPPFADLFGIYARRDLAIRLLAGRLDGAGAILALPVTLFVKGVLLGGEDLTKAAIADGSLRDRLAK